MELHETKPKLDKILEGECVVVSSEWLDTIGGSDIMRNIITIPNYGGPQDTYRAGLLSNPVIKQWRIEPRIIPVYQPETLAVVDDVSCKEIIVAKDQIMRPGCSFKSVRCLQQLRQC